MSEKTAGEGREVTTANTPRRSLQIDANFAFVTGREPWPRFWQHQDRLLASPSLTEGQKQKLRNWMAGKPVNEC